eukprot:TRINITY_DN8399_c0_g6_i1.p1 TRINITY_DN8399_c0_g6~~TRINITY_DN8399_c0_g6_i1.p1  ORF type:complete len:740 (+),score=209.09 TRINITY_DN8399_c0_g6_i1:65-2284(+)
MAGDPSPTPSAGGRRSGRKTHRRIGDVQYDFRMDIESLSFAGDHAAVPGAKYQVKWRRGDKLSGKTAALTSDPQDASGRIVWDYRAAYTSTIQKKDASRMHKKIVTLTLSEYRPKRGGKYDKVQFEAAFNLATCIGAVEKLGHDVPYATHCVHPRDANGGEPGLVLQLGVAAKVHDGDADNVQTDIPGMTEMSGADGEVNPTTEASIDFDEVQEEDDDLVDSVQPPPARAQPLFTAVEITPPGSSQGGLTMPPTASPGGVSMSEHLALAEELRAAKAEAAAELARAKKYKERAKAAEKRCLALEQANTAAAVRAPDAGVLQSLKAEHDAATKTLRKRARKEVQLFNEVTLLVDGVLLGRQGSAQGAAQTVARCLVSWGAFSKANNPGGLNTALANVAAVCRALEGSQRREERCWLAVFVHALLGELKGHCPSVQQVEAAARGFDAASGVDLAAFLREEVAAPTAAAPRAGRPTLRLPIGDEDPPVLNVGEGGSETCDAATAAFCVDMYGVLSSTMRAMFEDALSELEPFVQPFMDVAQGAPEEALLGVVKAHHAALLDAAAPNALVVLVLKTLFTGMGRMVFNRMLTTAHHCTDNAAVAYKSACGKLEAWMRQAKVYGRTPEDGCREALLLVRQTCDLVLLRGGTLHDPGLWSAILPEHVAPLLDNVRAAAGDGVAPDVEDVLQRLARDAPPTSRPRSWPSLTPPPPPLQPSESPLPLPAHLAALLPAEASAAASMQPE